MPEYYVKQEPDGDGFYEMHHVRCPHLEGVDLTAMIYVGRFNSCHKALAVARTFYTRADGCRRCSSSCHADRHEPLQGAG